MKRLGKTLIKTMLISLTILLGSISTVCAQGIEKESRNNFVLDSLGVKEYSSLILEKKSSVDIFKKYSQQLVEKDYEIGLKDDKIEIFKKNEIRFENTIQLSEREKKLILDKHKQELRKLKWQRNKSYIITGATIILSILVLSK